MGLMKNKKKIYEYSKDDCGSHGYTLYAAKITEDKLYLEKESYSFLYGEKRITGKEMFKLERKHLSKLEDILNEK